MKQRRKIQLRRFLSRWIFWVLVFALLTIVHFSRGKVDMLLLKAGNGQVTIYLMPATLGAEYFPEVYRDDWFEFETIDYGGIPFDGIFGIDGIEEDNYFPPALTGFFFFHHHSNGGPHWTLSSAVPLWFLGSFLAALLAAVVNFPKWKFLERTSTEQG